MRSLRTCSWPLVEYLVGPYDDGSTANGGGTCRVVRSRGMRPMDTSPEAWRLMEDHWRAASPAARLARVASLTALIHRGALAMIRKRHPDESDRQHRLRLAARYIDPETMRAAFGWSDDRPR